MARFALFDFDSTLTCKDTTRHLLFELVKLRPWKVLHLIGLVVTRVAGSAAQFQFAKNRCIGACVKGLSQERLAVACNRFHQRVRPLLRADILQRARDCHASGMQVVVVTASPEFAVTPLFEGEDFWCVGSRYSQTRGLHDGSLDGPPCYGEHKLPALRARHVDVTDDVVEAWSDSISDLPMMMLAAKRFWVCRSAEWPEILRVDPDGIRVQSTCNDLH